MIGRKTSKRRGPGPVAPLPSRHAAGRDETGGIAEEEVLIDDRDADDFATLVDDEDPDRRRDPLRRG